MEIIGIICEYNPFHNGHVYHINKIKELYPDSLIILCLNGYFCQRGDISILTKEDKVKIALDNMVDLVVELPTLYATQSADIFAEASIKILNLLKVNRVIFGSECDDIKYLEGIALKQLNDDYRDDLKRYLDMGLNYPSALNKALGINLNSPNDLLGVSYIKAILNNNFDIGYECIKRTSDYLDIDSDNEVVSASNIREKLKKNLSVDKYINYDYEFKMVDEELLFNIIKYKVNTDDNLSKYLSVDEGIEYKLIREINNCNCLDDLIVRVKSKRYTYNRIKRMLVHILIGIKKVDNVCDINYVKVLGFNNRGKSYLKLFDSNIVSSKISDCYVAQRYELISSRVYDLLTNGDSFSYECRNKPIIK